eukprot:3339315-Ditylum_brightwellii.AAC.1
MPSLENKAVFVLVPEHKHVQLKMKEPVVVVHMCARSRRRTAVNQGIIEPHERLTEQVLTQYLNEHPDQKNAFNEAVNANMTADDAI